MSRIYREQETGRIVSLNRCDSVNRCRPDARDVAMQTHGCLSARTLSSWAHGHAKGLPSSPLASNYGGPTGKIGCKRQAGNFEKLMSLKADPIQVSFWRTKLTHAVVQPKAFLHIMPPWPGASTPKPSGVVCVNPGLRPGRGQMAVQGCQTSPRPCGPSWTGQSLRSSRT